MRANSITRVIVLILLTSLLSGCFGWKSKPDDEVHYYVIDVNRSSVASEFVKNRVLLIKPVKLTSHFKTQNVVFKVGDNEFQPQPFDQFFSPPEEMFTEQLRRWLQRTGLFSSVIIDEQQPADMVLEVAVTALYGEVRQQFSPQSTLEMQFFLTSMDTDESKLLFQTGLRIDIDIDETTPSQVVKGWNIGLKELLFTLEDDLNGYFSKRNP